MDFSLREIECFIAVAEELSFTRAARRLHLAQPPLSRHIRGLEQKIGAELFVRGPRQVSLTAAGSLFYEETRQVPPALIRAGEAARRCAQGQTERLKLGFVSAVMNEALVEVFRRHRTLHPEVQVILQDLPPMEQLSLLEAGRLDGGFVGMAPQAKPPGIQWMAWYQEPLLAYLPVDHPLASQRAVDLRRLAAEPFIAVAHDAAPTFSSHVHGLCKQAGFRPRIVLESARAQAVALMVAAGAGAAILPAAVVGAMGKAVAALPIKGSPKITHVFACPKGHLTETMADFVRLLRARTRKASPVP